MSSYYLEDFKPGQIFTSSGRTITEADLTMFSMISGDWNPIHADAEFARGTRYGQRLVHGTLGIAICTGMLHQIGIFEQSVIAMLGLREWNFKQPIVVGDTVHLELEILSVEPGKSGRSGKLGRRFRLRNQRGEVAQEGDSDVLVLTHEGARQQQEQSSQAAQP
ncbi:MaoC/PaaZ C-terminal domain-containing protein [Herbaspirillum sp. SJZ099]|uniref:MaoC/PaaZ C-terminal domain-containing protein n=1 Tax=Herbaspirillum sp. SJZ099 TaxID=2572916 RepID=UPI0011A7C493|nr:MaoC/PaaZ C-terminal domain-containing protein [Herbaspirillum sp. SJZ099]TWC69786.1 acyl dehydratase [Herbaspirillum sp. SJZ099]